MLIAQGNVSELPKVAIITLNWNRKMDTSECILSLQQLDYPHFEIIVLDNGSVDGSPDYLEKTYPGITILKNEQNLGYSKGMNRCIEYVMKKGVQYILILNNDTIIDKDALRELVAVAETNPRIGMVSGKVYDYHKRNMLQTVGKIVNLRTGDATNVGYGEEDRGQYEQVKEYQYLDDVFWLVRTEVFSKVGMYNPEFFLYFEETDLCARANKVYQLIYTPKAKIWHKGSLSSGGYNSPTTVFYIARNKIIFVKNYASSPLSFAGFLLYDLGITTPLQLLNLLIKGRYSSIYPQIHGTLSGLRAALIKKESQ